MRVALINLTDSSFLFTEGDALMSKATEDTLGPLVAMVASSQKKRPTFKLIPQPLGAKASGGPSSELLLAWPRLSNKPWKALNLPEDTPYHVFAVKVSNAQGNLLILQKREMSSFLSTFPDSIPLSSLLLPGTHESMALHGWPISQCQSISSPLEMQFQSGIRFVDVRLSIVDGRLLCYHGIYPQQKTFPEVLQTIHAFLTNPKSSRETVIMSLKQEDATPWQTFSQLVRDDIIASPGGSKMWFLENRIPRLGEVRGKAILFSRFGGDGTGWPRGLDGMGIHPYRWPNSLKDGFSWDCAGTEVRTQDWYEIPSFLAIPDKFSVASQTLLAPPYNSSSPTLSISFFSAASFPLALPSIVAQGFGFPSINLGFEGVNSRLTKWLLDQLGGSLTPVNISDEKVTTPLDDNDEKKVRMAVILDEPRIRGWALLDFFDDPEPSLVPLLVECNYRGRRKGQEGW